MFFLENTKIQRNLIFPENKRKTDFFRKKIKIQKIVFFLKKEKFEKKVFFPKK